MDGAVVESRVEDARLRGCLLVMIVLRGRFCCRCRCRCCLLLVMNGERRDEIRDGLHQLVDVSSERTSVGGDELAVEQEGRYGRGIELGSDHHGLEMGGEVVQLLRQHAVAGARALKGLLRNSREQSVGDVGELLATELEEQVVDVAQVFGRAGELRDGREQQSVRQEAIGQLALGHQLLRQAGERLCIATHTANAFGRAGSVGEARTRCRDQRVDESLVEGRRRRRRRRSMVCDERWSRVATVALAVLAHRAAGLGALHLGELCNLWLVGQRHIDARRKVREALGR